MGTNIIWSLFDDRFKQQRDLIAGKPQSLSSISQQVEDQEYALQKISNFEQTKPLVDYSNFANFVFFNSALDYFNITGEKILNHYPFDGSRQSLQAYLDDLDDYQGYVVSVWPSNVGHLRFNPVSGPAYIVINDLGYDEGRVGNIAQTGMLSPSTSSWTIEGWCIPPPTLTGSNDSMFLIQKVTGSGDGYTVYFSGSNLYFRMVSGSFKDEISVPSVPGQNSYFACVLDKTLATPLLSAYTGTLTSFPVLVASASSLMGTNTNPINAGTVPLYIGSGSLAGKTTRMLSGSVDNFRLWNTNRQLADLSSSFNTKIFAQRNLQALWNFNETGSITDSPNVTLDYSGHKLHGAVKNYFGAMRGSGSIMTFDQPDLVLSYNEPTVNTFINTQQLSGTIFDRSNDNHIINLLPSEFFKMEELKGTTILQNFLYVLAREFDYIKVRMDQFVHVLTNNYTQFNKTPDSLLEDIGRFFGWEFTGNFLNANAFQYLLGKGVLVNVDSNRDLDTKLFQIKNEFWRRILINLMHIYKTKGTRESVESLFRIYGINKNFVRLKEYGVKPFGGISTFRIASEKSVNALAFGSGSMSGSYVISSVPFSSSLGTMEVRLRFPTTSSVDLVPTLLTGSIWALNNFGSSDPNEFPLVFPVQFGSSSSPPFPTEYQLTYVLNAIGSSTGSFIYSGSDTGQLILSGVTAFDDKWYNVAVTRNTLSSSVSLSVRALDIDKIRYSVSATAPAPFFSGTDSFFLTVGTDNYGSQFWAQEMRVWERPLTSNELDDHTLNFQSYGEDNVVSTSAPTLHWRMNEGISGSASGTIVNQIIDVSTNNFIGSGYGFLPNWSSYKKFLCEYNYIAAPDLGYNEKKIRVIPSTFVSPNEAFVDNRMIGLEFNMIDALNEDISQMFASLDQFNNAIGMPNNRYRENYHDLRVMRDAYFKRLQGRLNFRVFSDMLAFFDRSFVDMIRRLIPARAIFLGDEFIVESHMLERPKLQWNYRRQTPIVGFEGVVPIYIRNEWPPRGYIVGQSNTQAFFNSASRKQFLRGIHIANAPGARSDNVQRQGASAYHINTVFGVRSPTMDQFNMSGVIKYRYSKKGFQQVPLAVRHWAPNSVDRFGNPVFPFTGKSGSL